MRWSQSLSQSLSASSLCLWSGDEEDEHSSNAATVVSTTATIVLLRDFGTYVLRPSAASINLDELAKMSREDHRQAFFAFLAGLIADFDRYLARDDISPGRDGSGFRLAGMWLTDTEANELGHDLLAALQPRLANPPKRGRKR